MMYFMPDAADANTPATGPGENPEASASDTNRSTIEDAQYQRREQLLQQLQPNFEVLSMSGQSAFTQLKSLLNQEKALLEAIIPKLSSLEESVKKEFLENINSPIVLPESLSLNATEEIEFKNNLNQLISTREQFEAQIEQVLDTISSANQRAHSEHYKKCTIAMLQSRLGFEPREGLTLRSKLWNDNSTYKILSIDPTASKEIEINNQKRLINDVNFKVQKTDSQSEELFELSSSDFQVLCRGQELQPQIRNLQELTKIHQFDKYGQAIHPGFEFTYTVDGKNELASQIQEYDSEQNLVKFTSPIHWKQETYSELSLESFSQFMYDSKSFEQKLNQTQARTLLETIKNLRSNQIDSINSFELKNNDIIAFGSYYYVLENFTDEQISFQKLNNPKGELNSDNFAGGPMSFNYARLIYHLKHSDFEFIRNAQPPVKEEDQFEFRMKESEKNQSKSEVEIPPLMLGGLFTPQTTLEFAKSFFSQYIEFSSLASLGQVVKNVGDAITSYTDRRTKNAANRLLSKANNSTVRNAGVRGLAGDIASEANSYKERIANTEDINKYFESLYNESFGTKEDDLYKAQALIEILVERGLLRFESIKLGRLVNRLLKLANLSEYQAQEANGKFTYPGYKGRDWIVFALGKIYGPTAANGWEGTNTSSFTSKVQEGEAYAARQFSNTETQNVGGQIHNELSKITNNDFENTKHPGYLIGMLNALVENSNCPLEDLLFYMTAFAAITYYGDEPILPPESLTKSLNNIDYAKYPYYSGYWSSKALSHGQALMDPKVAQGVLQKFDPDFQQGANPGFDREKVRAYFFQNLMISQENSPDNYEKGIENNGPAGHSDRAIYLISPRYNQSTMENHIIGTTTQQSPTFGAAKLRHIAYGLSNGLKMALVDHENPTHTDGPAAQQKITIYNLRRMISSWFSYATAVEDRNYLGNNRNRVQFTKDDFNYIDTWIDPATTVGDQLGMVNNFLRELVSKYNNHKFDFGGEMRSITNEDLKLWFDKDYALKEATNAKDSKDKEEFNSKVQVFHSIIGQIIDIDQKTFIQNALDVANNNPLGTQATSTEAQAYERIKV